MEELPDYTQGHAIAAFECVKKYLDDLGWIYTTWEKKLTIVTGMRGRNASFRILAQVSNLRPDLNLYIHHAVFVPEERRAEACELLTRINWRVSVGRFEMDVEDGEVRVSVTHLFPERLDPQTIHRLMLISLGTTDHYAPAIQAVTLDGLSAREALARVTGKQTQLGQHWSPCVRGDTLSAIRGELRDRTAPAEESN